MPEEILLNVYKNLLPGVKKIYIVPLINFRQKNTNYLYLFYKNIFDEKNNSFPEIESLSVFSHPKFVFKKLSGEKNILHYHWFEVQDLQSLLGIFWKLFWIIFYKLAGGKIVWTVHNKYPHNTRYFFLNKNIRKFMAKLADKLHVHCRTAVDIMSAILNTEKDKFFVVEHPSYPAGKLSKKEAVDSLNKRYKNLNLKSDIKTFLMFGAIAGYKRISDIIEIFKKDYEYFNLLITGPVKRWDKKYFNEVQKSAEGFENIIIINKFIPDEDIALFFSASDYVIFNFEDILTSGGIYLALSYNKKIIAPASGCIKEIKNENLFLFEADGNRKENLKKIIENIHTN